MRESQLIHRPQPRHAASGAVALDVSEALSGKFLIRRMQGVHRPKHSRRTFVRHSRWGVYSNHSNGGRDGDFHISGPGSIRLPSGFMGSPLQRLDRCHVAASVFGNNGIVSKPFSMLCVAKKGTGFDWKNNDWQQATYKPSTYVLSKLGGDAAKEKCWPQILSEGVDISDPIASGTSRGCYIIKELGESEKDVLGDVCTEHWDERGKGPVLNKVSCSFNYEVRARVDGPFVLTRTNAIFATEDRFRTSVSLEIGKCSLFEAKPQRSPLKELVKPEPHRVDLGLLFAKTDYVKKISPAGCEIPTGRHLDHSPVCTENPRPY